MGSAPEYVRKGIQKYMEILHIYFSSYPEKDLIQLVAITAMCLQEESAARPLMIDVVTALINANVSYFHRNMID